MSSTEKDPISKCLEKARIGHPVTKGEAVRALKKYDQVKFEMEELRKHVDEPTEGKPLKSASSQLRESQNLINKLKAEIARLKERRYEDALNRFQDKEQSPRFMSRSSHADLSPERPTLLSALKGQSRQTKDKSPRYSPTNRRHPVPSSTLIAKRDIDDVETKPNLLSVMRASGPYLIEAKTVTVAKTPQAVEGSSAKSSRKSTLQKVDIISRQSVQTSAISQNLKKTTPVDTGISQNNSDQKSSKMCREVSPRSQKTDKNMSTNTAKCDNISPRIVKHSLSAKSPASGNTVRKGSPKSARSKASFGHGSERSVRFADQDSLQIKSHLKTDWKQVSSSAERSHEVKDVSKIGGGKDVSVVGGDKEMNLPSSSGEEENKGRIEIPEPDANASETDNLESEDNGVGLELKHMTDPHKPMELVKALTYIYNDEWRQVLLEMMSQQAEEEIVIRILADIVKEAYAFCLNLAKQQMDELWENQEFVLQHVIATPGQKSSGYKQLNQTPDSGVLLDRQQMEATENYLQYYQQIMAGKSTPGVLAAFRRHLSLERIRKETGVTSLPESLDTYIDAVLPVSWRMSIRNPPLHQVWLEPGVAVDTNRFTFYVVPGKTVQQTVWPAICYKQNGTLLAKGIVITK